MDAFEALGARLSAIQDHLGYQFKNPDHLRLAFIHRSFANEYPPVEGQHNERLEFLGDSVLGLIVSDFLYTSLPQEAEGELSHLRAYLVDAERCSKYTQMLGVGEWVLLGRGEQMNEGRGRETILADLFEAIIGAIFIDGGLDAAKDFFKKHFSGEVTGAMKSPQHNWKAELQDYSQKRTQKPPVYRVIKEEGPDHNKLFSIEVLVADEVVGKGEGSSKKQAEQEAAKDAIEGLIDG